MLSPQMSSEVVTAGKIKVTMLAREPAGLTMFISKMLSQILLAITSYPI